MAIMPYNKNYMYPNQCNVVEEDYYVDGRKCRLSYVSGKSNYLGFPKKEVYPRTFSLTGLDDFFRREVNVIILEIERMRNVHLSSGRDVRIEPEVIKQGLETFFEAIRSRIK